AESLHQIADQIHKRSLVILFTDMFDHADKLEDIFTAIQHLKHNKHEVILFHVVDRNLELEFNFENRPYQFVDMETGEKVRLQTHQIKEKYLNNIQKYHDSIKSKCIQYRIDYNEADIHAGYDYILQSFLVKRKKMN
ncbi:MAG TPA: DUF58 domain-containing protein, partial [Saprospiraceae bacterium]|nr:DUF58 domain-containing protein [Saprospiraceae bacterium]